MQRINYEAERRLLEERMADALWTCNLNEEYLRVFMNAWRQGGGSSILRIAINEARKERAAAKRLFDETEEALVSLRKRWKAEQKRRLEAMITGFARKAVPVVTSLAAIWFGAAYQLEREGHQAPIVEEKIVRYEPIPVANEELPEGVKEHLKAAGLTTDTIYVVDKLKQEGVVYQIKFEELKRVKVSTGINPGDKQQKGDHRTPETRPGEFFYVMSVQDSHEWADPFEGKKGAYGPYALRFDTLDGRLARWGDGQSPFLHHGTLEADKIGTPASHGCVRHLNKDLTEMVEKNYLGVGTPTIIGEGILCEKQTKIAGGTYGAR